MADNNKKDAEVTLTKSEFEKFMKRFDEMRDEIKSLKDVGNDNKRPFNEEDLIVKDTDREATFAGVEFDVTDDGKVLFHRSEYNDNKGKKINKRQPFMVYSIVDTFLQDLPEGLTLYGIVKCYNKERKLVELTMPLMAIIDTRKNIKAKFTNIITKKDKRVGGKTHKLIRDSNGRVVDRQEIKLIEHFTSRKYDLVIIEDDIGPFKGMELKNVPEENLNMF